ncbi:MAG: hypothetical protein R8G33_07185 [Gammaproteobacteria bacterium]|nr:hypothetical protein [Gammaproteobacteria bacterium]
MSQIVLHLGEEYIKEDLEYYFSGERDKNNQVRPDRSIYSMTPFSQHIEMDFDDGEVGNFFYPVLPDALDRIYIGISVSLFANHWGASFILELLKHLKPGGSIIVPVYPEGQAAEKDFWSRSFLENIFLSRARWTGFSNITAENDGVMSIRVGRKWPAPMPSSIEWFFKERSNLLLASIQTENSASDISKHLKQTFIPLCKMIWDEYSTSAVTEKIIADYVGKNQDSEMLHVGTDYGMLSNDVILSSLVKVHKAHSWHIGDYDTSLANSIYRYFSAHTQDQHQMDYSSIDNISFDGAHNVVVISGLYSRVSDKQYKQLLHDAWKHLSVNGVLIVHEDMATDKIGITNLEAMMTEIGEVSYHSAIAARKIEPSVEISQYSLAVEENLRQEKLTKQNVFRVIHKV